MIRPCPRCGSDADKLTLIDQYEQTHRHLQHACRTCGQEVRSHWILPHALKHAQGNRPADG